MLLIEKIQRLDLGIRGENKTRQIMIDCNAWKQMYPDGAISVYHKRNGENAMSVTGAVYDPDTGILTWEPTAYDTTYAGEGEAEIRVTEAGVIRKNTPIITIVWPSIVNEEGTELESNWDAYIDEVERLKSLTQAAANRVAEDTRDAEAWAVGERDGEPVEQTDPTYHNNAKFYCDAADQKLDDHSHGYIFFYIDESTGRLIYNAVNDPNIDFEMDDGRLIAKWQEQ